MINSQKPFSRRLLFPFRKSFDRTIELHREKEEKRRIDEFFHSGKTRLSRQAEAALLIFRRRVRFSTLAGPPSPLFKRRAITKLFSPIIDRVNPSIRRDRFARRRIRDEIVDG